MFPKTASITVHYFTVRLVGGASSHEGRLEILRNGTWGTVCDDFFTNAGAQVACYMLGFGYHLRAFTLKKQHMLVILIFNVQK